MPWLCQLCSRGTCRFERALHEEGSGPVSLLLLTSSDWSALRALHCEGRPPACGGVQGWSPACDDRT